MGPKFETLYEVVAEDVERDAERNKQLHELVAYVSEFGVELGSGKLGTVRAHEGSPEFTGTCVKMIPDVHSEHTVNDIEAEFNYQQKVHDLGVRVPLPFLAAEAADGRAFLAMETINGCSWDDVVVRGVQLPAKYDHERYWKKAKEMFERMHAEGYHHRDVWRGNLMVEEATGDPVIIDFGNATYAFGDEDPYNQPDTLRGEMNHFRDDLQSLRQLRIDIEKHLTGLGKNVSIPRTS